MKYIIVLGDGMADEPVEILGGKTPLQKADKKAIDHLAKTGEVGLVCMVPEGMSPGSDTANLSVVGYNPKIYYQAVDSHRFDRYQRKDYHKRTDP